MTEGSPTPRFVTSFPRQFVAAEHLRPIPAGWTHDVVHGWSLWHCPALPVRSIVDGRGGEIGWVVGEAVPPGRPRDALRVEKASGDPAFIPALERELRSIAGTHIGIVAAPPVARVYSGPAGMPAVVYNATERTIASSLRLARTSQHSDSDVIQALDIPKRDHYFPFGLTPDLRVRRLLPNHFLDLATFQAVRHWPPPVVRFGAAREPVVVVEALARRLRERVESLASLFPIGIALTAGRDTRMIVAAGRRLAPAPECVTVFVSDEKGRLDCNVAAAIARRVHLPHRIVTWVTPTPADLDEWQERTGHCVAGRVWQGVTTRKQLSDIVVLSGTGAEVGRSFYWREHHLNGGRVSAEHLISKLRLPGHPRLVAEADNWLGSLPLTEAPDVLDLLYLEQRLGCWAAPQGYGNTALSVSPFCDSQTFDLMLSLPWDYRFSQRLTSDLIARLWPELLKFPFNQEIGLRRAVDAFKAGARSALRFKAFRTH